MEPNPSDVWLGGFILALAAASVTTWLVLFRQMRSGPLLPYEPRRPVPWGPAAGVLITLFVLSHVVNVFAGDGPPEFDDPAEMVQRIAEASLMQTAVFGTFFVAVVIVSRATQQDIGLPEFADQFGRDLKLGIIGWLAALVPVYGLQGLLASAVDEPATHPLIQALLDTPSAVMIALAFLAAVILAPICEELAFRLLLQSFDLSGLADIGASGGHAWHYLHTGTAGDERHVEAFVAEEAAGLRLIKPAVLGLRHPVELHGDFRKRFICGMECRGADEQGEKGKGGGFHGGKFTMTDKRAQTRCVARTRYRSDRS